MNSAQESKVCDLMPIQSSWRINVEMASLPASSPGPSGVSCCLSPLCLQKQRATISLTCQSVQTDIKLWNCTLGKRCGLSNSILCLVFLPAFGFLLFHFNYTLAKRTQMASSLVMPASHSVVFDSKCLLSVPWLNQATFLGPLWLLQKIRYNFIS